MPDFEFEFNQQDRDLIISQTDGTLNENDLSYDGDYVRLIVYEADTNVIFTFDDDTQAIFYSSLSENQFSINISPFSNGTEAEPKTIGGGDGDGNDFKIYKNDTTQDIYLKPNELFNQRELPEGIYKIQIDFLNQVKRDSDTGQTEHYEWIVKQVSTSRKEVRLKLLNENIESNSELITLITDEFNTNTDGDVTDKYQFKHLLNIGTGDHNPIMNYAFDRFTDGPNNQSLILKLYDTLPSGVTNLSSVTIEREVLTTQVQETFYFSEIEPTTIGDGLDSDPQENWINPDGNNFGFQNYDELSGSIDTNTLNGLISQSQYNYPNLNTDFRFFHNHTFFGSAKSKIVNFKNKVETIQGHYTKISASLSTSGSAIEGDSTFLKQYRQDLFNKVSNEINSFTPYEKFLYYDAQSNSTASAPGLINYADSTPIRLEDSEGTQLNGHDGFNVVYKHSTENMSDGNVRVDIFNGKNLVQNKPFFNYSGSIYLSFLLKGDDFISSSKSGEFGGAGLRWDNVQTTPQTDNDTHNPFNGLPVPLPEASLYRNNVSNPVITGSEYRRFIYEASMSYWIPDTSADISDFNDLSIADFENGTNIQFLSSSFFIKTGSAQIADSTGMYPINVTSQSIDGEPVGSGFPFLGACMPAGDPFFIRWAHDSAGITSSFITDVKISLTNPTNILPFDNVYETTSTEWTNWYNGIYDSASAYDDINIHSLENNLPLYIKDDSSNYNEMKDFLNLQGEKYDLIKNHIDSLGTLNDRGYKKTNSPPDNTLPMLLTNIGWQAINPFQTGSLNDSLGQYLTGVTTIDDIKNETWRKTLNNIIHIYKTKGTKNSVRSLLNVYGYPPDLINFQEFGGSTGDIIQSSPGFIKNTPPEESGIDTDVNLMTGSVQFISRKQKLYNYMFSKKPERTLNLDWWMDGAEIETFEFVYKHKNSTNTQTILESSGSGTETLWDLRLVPSTDAISSSFQFRLNNTRTGSLAISSNALSMSTSFNPLTDGQLWNVMLQRMSSSVSGSGTNEYRLHTSLQDKHRIRTYNYVTMSVSGGLSADSNFRANENFQSSGSRHANSSSNLFVGETLSGSLTQIKAWNSSLSSSKFRQHTFNKFSTVGNTINSYKDELLYHFKLNENYSTSSISSSTQHLIVVDSAPKTNLTTDFSFGISGSLFSGSSAGQVYGYDYVHVINFSIQDNTTTNKRNEKTILINPTQNVVGNLNPFNSAVKSLTEQNSKPSFINSSKLEIYHSPQNFVDDFILDTLSGFNFETLYGNPQNYYSQSYNELDTFRENFFDAHPITVDTNTFIRAHESMFNHSIVEGIKTLVPARSTFSDRNSNIGVEIRPTILEKQKFENEYHSVETNPNTATSSLSVISIESLMSGSAIETIKSGSISVISIESIATGSNIESPKSGSITIVTPETIATGSLLVLPKSGSISASPKTTGSSIDFPKSGSIDDGLRLNKSYVSVHKNWGTSSSDVHHINFAADTGSYGTFNTYDIEKKFVFNAVGDNEYYSASRANSSDFTNIGRFYNRLMIDNDFNASTNYESLIGDGNTNQSGKMMGKTRYFTTSSNGDITLPRNHVTKFSNPFTDTMYSGSKNTNPGILNVRYEDYSTASFYRVKVTGGENQIRVQSGVGTPSGDGKIIY